MVGSMFAAISGLKAHQTRMDVIGNNIANVNTWGYKSQSANFTDATYRTKTQGKAGNVPAAGNPGNPAGGTNASQVGYGVNVGLISTNFDTGNWNPTGLASDCMIDGPAFFLVSKTGGEITLEADGTIPDANKGDVYLSKVGMMKLDSNGYLVDDMGNFILSSKGARIQGEPDMQYSSIRISADGKITGVRAKDGATGSGISSGSDYVFKDNGADAQIGLAVPTNVNGLEKTQGYYLQIGPNAGAVAVSATSVATGDIRSGYLEMSNTDLSNEMATMITTQRGYQANTKIITVTDEMLEQLVNMKR